MRINQLYRLTLMKFVGLLVVSAAIMASGLANAQQRQVPQSQTEVLLSYSPVVKEVAPAVVNIFTKRVIRQRTSPMMDDPFFNFFFGGGRGGVPQERIQGSLGSGVIVTAEGTIITNYHVIKGAERIEVVLADRREFDATVELVDERTDLAVLRINSGDEDLPFVPLANSDDIEVGDIALAIGNPFGVGQTVTSGIVSATARTTGGVNDLNFFLQTDAAVNPGNSGGALVGLDGRLIGINTAIFSRSGGSNGIGFAVPSNMVASVLNALETSGEIVRPWIGIAGQTVDGITAESLGLSRPGGVVIDDVYPGSPAFEAGLMPSDVILMVANREVNDLQAFNFRIATQDPTDSVRLTVFRNGTNQLVEVQLTPLPEDPPRNITRMDGEHFFRDVSFGNLSPKFADELGLDPMTRGVIVTDVPVRSPAARRGLLRPGDILLTINSEPVTNVNQLRARLVGPFDRFVYRLRRAGRITECIILGLRSFTCRS